MAVSSMDKYLPVLCCLLFIGSTIAKQQQQPKIVHVVDGNSIENVAKFVCEVTEGNDWQIEKISTIAKLADFFETLPLEHELSECKNRYYDSMKQLNLLINTSNGDVCNPVKINLIVDFHQNYVSKSAPDVETQVRDSLEAPRLLVLFYLHYTYQVGAICKKSLIEQLDSAEAKENELKLADKSEELKELDSILRDYTSLTGSFSGSLKGASAVTLLWTLVDKSPFKSNPEFFDTPTPPNFYRITFASADGEKLKRCQHECRALKPLYESSLLATIRLIDLGYYVNDESFAAELKKRPNLRRLIGVVSFCESLLPVQVITDTSLQPGQSVMLSNSKAEKLYPDAVDNRDHNVAPFFEYNMKNLERNSWGEIDSLSSVTPVTANPLIESLTANIMNRERMIVRVMKIIAGMMKLKVMAFFGKLFSIFKNKQNNEIFPSDLLPLFGLLA